MEFENIYIDMDGVLCDFVYSFLSLHNRLDLYDRMATPMLPNELGLSEKDTWAPIIAMGRQFWEELPVYNWTHQLIQTMEQYGEITILTRPLNGMGSLSDHAVGQSTEGKLTWLYRELGIRSTDVILTSKKHCLSKPGVLLIDDDERYYESFTLGGGKMIVLPQSYNSLSSMLHDRMAAITGQLDALNKPIVR